MSHTPLQDWRDGVAELRKVIHSVPRVSRRPPTAAWLWLRASKMRVQEFYESSPFFARATGKNVVWGEQRQGNRALAALKKDSDQFRPSRRYPERSQREERTP